DRNKAVKITLGEPCYSNLDHRRCRIRYGVRKHLPGDASPVKLRGCPIEMTRADEKGISDDQRLRQAKPGHHAREFGERAAANRHQARGRDDRCHKGLLRAPRLSNQTAPDTRLPEIIRQNRSADKGFWRSSSRAASAANPVMPDGSGSFLLTNARARR